MVYDCVCCRLLGADFCRCVFATCPSCARCLAHCDCPLRHARRCEPDPELDAAGGPFADLFPHNGDAPTETDAR